MVDRTPIPRLELLGDPADVARVLTAIRCTDCDALPKVAGAGDVFEIDGVSVQRMHNGVLVEEGSYAGAWMTEIIRSLRGHHEPQEEAAFATIMDRLTSSAGPVPRMLEFGSFWSYYSIWFARDLPGAEVLAMEPDPHNLDVGRRNAELNGVSDSVEFLHGAIGMEPGSELRFANESDDSVTVVRQHDLGSLMARQGWDHVDVALVDVQGAETILLERAEPLLMAGRVRFLVVSTHHHRISGDPLTHQNALELIIRTGGHIIAEHTVGESFSGDGLIVASFDPQDIDLEVAISYARARDSVFGELEPELAGAYAEVARLGSRLQEADAELSRVKATRLWRWSAPLRAAYRRLRRR